MKGKEQSHILDVLDFGKLILSTTGYWPRDNPTWGYRCRAYFTWMVDIAFVTILSAEVIKNIIYSEFEMLTEVVTVQLSFVCYVVKHTIFDAKRATFVGLLQKLEDPVLHDFPSVCDAYIKRENHVVLMCMRSFQLCTLGMVTMSGLKPFTTGEVAVRFTVFELGNWFYPMHILLLVGMASGCCNSATFDGASMALMSIGSSQFEVLKQKLMHSRKWVGIATEDIDKGAENPDYDWNQEFDDKLKLYIKGCVQHHLKILDIVKDVDEVFCYLLLTQFFTSVLAICNTWFQFMLEREVAKMMFLACYAGALLVQLGVYCLAGDKVKEKSEELREGCYFSEWDKSNNSVRLSLMIMMERAKRPNLMTAGKIAYVNLPQYTSLMRMSYSYFALMNRMYGK